VFNLTGHVRGFDAVCTGGNTVTTGKTGEEMPREITRLVLDIDLRHYAEDARATIAKGIINRAVNNGSITEDDVAIFLEGELKITPEEGKNGVVFKVEQFTQPRRS